MQTLYHMNVLQRQIEAVKVELSNVETDLNNIGRVSCNLPAVKKQLISVQVVMIFHMFVLWYIAPGVKCKRAKMSMYNMQNT